MLVKGAPVMQDGRQVLESDSWLGNETQDFGYDDATHTKILRGWWNMMTSSNKNIFRVTGPLWGEFTSHWWIPLTKASDAELWCLNKRLSKPLGHWLFEMPLHSLWCLCSDKKWPVQKIPTRRRVCIAMLCKIIPNEMFLEAWLFCRFVIDVL